MAHRQHLQSAFKVLIMYKHRITTRSAVAGSPVSLEGNCVCTLDRQEVWKGGLTAWREGEWHDVIAHISTHTVRLTAGGGLCLTPSVLDHKQCVLLVRCCVHIIIQSSKCS